VRRYSAFTDEYMQGSIPLHRFITIAALFTGAVQLLFFYNLIRSRFRGPATTENPWQATTLEWTTSSPPPHDNFGGHPPTVYRGPNEYGVEGPRGDYVMQTDPQSAAR
jgi:cytochrome c oxidase subunit 1